MTDKERIDELTKRLDAARDRYTAGVSVMQKRIDDLKEQLTTAQAKAKIDNDFSESVAEAVQEMAEKWAALSERIEQLGTMIDTEVAKSRVNALYGVQTFTEEKTSDGGTMTINYSACYQDMIGILLNNDYYVCGHVNDNDTITIEFWRA